MRRYPKPSVSCAVRVVLFLLSLCLGAARAEPPSLSVGLTPVFLDNQPLILDQWREYLKRHTGQPIDFIQRGSYQEIVDLLLRGDLDVAWLCGLPYVEHQNRLSLIAVPLYQGAPLYRSYLIVPITDNRTRSWKTLTPGVFAFSDPNSNSGYLYPRWAMQQAGIDVELYFRKTFFTRGHREVVEAVAVRLADAGAVDGYVWETLNRDHPELTGATRIVTKSETFGFPPIVSRNNLPAGQKRKLRQVLVGMAQDPLGREILKRFNLDGFVAGKPALYDSIVRMSRALGRIR